jgi:hypothetical protein
MKKSLVWCHFKRGKTHRVVAFTDGEVRRLADKTLCGVPIQKDAVEVRVAVEECQACDGAMRSRARGPRTKAQKEARAKRAKERKVVYQPRYRFEDFDR